MTDLIYLKRQIQSIQRSLSTAQQESKGSIHHLSEAASHMVKAEIAIDAHLKLVRDSDRS